MIKTICHKNHILKIETHFDMCYCIDYYNYNNNIYHEESYYDIKILPIEKITQDWLNFIGEGEFKIWDRNRKINTLLDE